jgi:uncharacterized heparinase superfamily protein
MLMAAGTLASQGRLLMRWAPRGGGSGPLRRFLLSRMSRFTYPGPAVEQVLLAPQELRTADPSFATEIYNGHFGLAGRLAELDSQSPFEIVPPSASWARELHGFGWLRHLRAAGSQLSAEQARALVREWMTMHHAANGLAWEPDVAARRVISWLASSVMVLEGADAKFYETFMRSLTVHLRYLSASYKDARAGQPRLLALMALVYAGLCVAEQQAAIDRFTRPLNLELKRQILADGGHVSRNPAMLVELLLDLLPLRQCFVARDRMPPKPLNDAIDRIMPMLRFFRLGDGNLARFNGCGATATDALATVLAYDDAEGAPLKAAPGSGYARLEQGRTRLICDLGAAPAGALGAHAHAGCLSFEMSSGEHPIVVNCGAPNPSDDEWRPFARSTPAHSTLSIDNTSSAEFHTAGNAVQTPGEGNLTGPPNVQGSLRDDNDLLELRASHQGYFSAFGRTHVRHIAVSSGGLSVSGEDIVSAARGPHGGEGLPVTVRFHLHPGVNATPTEDGLSVLLTLPDGEAWKFGASAPAIGIDNSVFLGDERGPQPCFQIVLGSTLGGSDELRFAWSFTRLHEGNGASKKEADVPPDAPAA